MSNARPLPPKGRAPAVVARQLPRTPPAPLCGILAQRADVWNPVSLGRSVFDGVERLVLDVGAFAVELADDLVDFIGQLPSPAELMQLAITGIKDKLSKAGGLCLAPASSCPNGHHINSGKQEDLVPDLTNLEILASHRMIAHAYRIPPTQGENRPRIALSDHPPLSRPLLGHTPEAAPMWQAETTLSVCFNMYDFELDATGLEDAITDFWENNPAVKAVQRLNVARQGSSAAGTYRLRFRRRSA